MITINEVILQELPFLDAINDATLIETLKKSAFYALQIPLNKSDLEVENEGSYSNQERLLIGYYASMNYVTTYLDGNLSSTGVASNVIEKKLKADVVEIEYELNGNLATYSTTLTKSQKKVCNQASLMSVSLPFCGAVEGIDITNMPYGIGIVRTYPLL